MFGELEAATARRCSLCYVDRGNLIENVALRARHVPAMDVRCKYLAHVTGTKDRLAALEYVQLFSAEQWPTASGRRPEEKPAWTKRITW